MKLSCHALAASLAICTFAQTAAHAEEYEGVLQFQSSASRSGVRTQAIDAAHAPNPYSDAISSLVAAAPSQARERGAVRAEAVARAHEPAQNLKAEAFTDSRIPASYYKLDARLGNRLALARSQG